MQSSQQFELGRAYSKAIGSDQRASVVLAQSSLITGLLPILAIADSRLWRQVNHHFSFQNRLEFFDAALANNEKGPTVLAQEL